MPDDVLNDHEVLVRRVRRRVARHAAGNSNPGILTRTMALKLTDQTDKLALSSQPAKRLKAGLDRRRTAVVDGSTPMTVREPVGHAEHHQPAIITRG